MTVLDQLQQTTPAPGFYHGTSFKDYVAWDALNWHTLEPFRKSAKHGRNEMAVPTDGTNIQAAMEGFHAAVLEPERFATEFPVMPRFAGHPNSNAYKQAKAEWEAEHSQQSTLTVPQRQQIDAMAEAIRAHPLASKIMAGKGKNEVGIIWRDPKTGAMCKGRVDTIRRIKMGLVDLASPTPDADIIALIDLKGTCGSVKNKAMPLSESFRYEISKYAYHGQVAWYHDGITTLNPAPVVPLIIAVENTGDFDVCVFDMRPMLEVGRDLYRKLMKRMNEGLRTSKWPGCSDYIVPVFPFPSESDALEIKEEE